MKLALTLGDHMTSLNTNLAPAFSNQALIVPLPVKPSAPPSYVPSNQTERPSTGTKSVRKPIIQGDDPPATGGKCVSLSKPLAACATHPTYASTFLMIESVIS